MLLADSRPTPLPQAPDPARLAFAGTTRVGHTPLVVQRDPLAVLGARLVLCWSHGTAFGEALLSGREVLARAATMNDCSLAEAVAMVGSHLAELHDLREQTMARLVTEIGRITAGLQADGVMLLSQVTPQHCVDFIEQAVVTRAGGWSEPSISTQYLRRTAIRLFFGAARQLHLADGDPTLDIRLPPRSASTTRPLGDDEEALGRVWSQPTLASTRHPVAWALGQATATGSEQAAVAVRDLDLPNSRVWLSGNEKWRVPRWGHLTEWGMIQVERRLAVVGTDPEARLVSAATASRNARQASACLAVGQVLTHAGLRSDPGVKPGSLPAWAGRQVYKATGRVEDARDALGVRSLDRAAAIIGYER